MYDHYVSLGENCEAAFNFRRILGKDISYYFNWLVTPLDSLIDIIENDFKDDFEIGNLYHKNNQIIMITDKRYNISHHSPFKEIEGQLSGSDFETIYKNHKDKLSLFKKRFRALAQSKLFVLYFIKAGELTGTTNVRIKCAKLRDIMLNHYPDHKFNIVVLQEKNRLELQWDEPRIFNRYLDRFAPYNNVPDYHKESWDRIFSEFPLNPGAMERTIA